MVATATLASVVVNGCCKSFTSPMPTLALAKACPFCKQMKNTSPLFWLCSDLSRKEFASLSSAVQTDMASSVNGNFQTSYPDYNKSSSIPINTTEKLSLPNMSRRAAAAAAAAAIMASLSITEASHADGLGLNLQMVAPDQTVEEAIAGIRDHAQALLEVKSLLNSDSLVEAQRELRRSSSLLKLDIYTIIQAKPGTQRPQLRNLYSKLFKNVTNLDYAARERDTTRVWECYNNIVLTLTDILSKI